jgi:hypothetical protein
MLFLKSFFVNFLLINITNESYFQKYHFKNNLNCDVDTFANEPNGFDLHKKGLLDSKTTCDVCNILLPVIKKLVADNKTTEFQPIAISICSLFGYGTQSICELLVKQYEVNYSIFLTPKNEVHEESLFKSQS